jgi:hypothetical protein
MAGVVFPEYHPPGLDDMGVQVGTFRNFLLHLAIEATKHPPPCHLIPKLRNLVGIITKHILSRAASILE